MIRETKLCVHHRQLSSMSNRGRRPFLNDFDINFGTGIFLHLSTLPQGQTTYHPLGRHHLCVPYTTVVGKKKTGGFSFTLSLQGCSTA